MKHSDRDFIMKNVQEMMAASSCCDEAKQAGQAWLDAVGTDREHSATRTLIEELFLHVLPTDKAIEWLSSPEGREKFGPETASKMLENMKQLRQQGDLYCDCPACTPAKAILQRRLDLV